VNREPERLLSSALTVHRSLFIVHGSIKQKIPPQGDGIIIRVTTPIPPASAGTLGRLQMQPCSSNGEYPSCPNEQFGTVHLRQEARERRGFRSRRGGSQPVASPLFDDPERKTALRRCLLSYYFQLPRNLRGQDLLKISPVTTRFRRLP
jgi:hypothetical protein